MLFSSPAALAVIALLIQDPAFDGAARLDQAAVRVAEVGLGADTPEFRAALPHLRARAAKATAPYEMLPIYRDLLSALGDRHSFVQAPDDQLVAWREAAGEPLYAASSSPRWTSRLTGRPASSRLEPLDNGHLVQVVVVPEMPGGGRVAHANAQSLYDPVRRDWPEACAAILDLRGNTGGNAWPMLLALSPILGEGEYGPSQDASGASAPYARIADGSAIVLEGEYAGAAMARVTDWARPEPHTRAIAILIDDATASSGEQVALEFMGQSNVRTFGQTSYGVASSNLGVPVADDVNLVVTTALMQDRLGRTWPTGIIPDVRTEGEAATLEAALAWTGASEGCQQVGSKNESVSAPS